MYVNFMITVSLFVVLFTVLIQTLLLLKFVLLQVEVLVNMAAPKVLSKWCPNVSFLSII